MTSSYQRCKCTMRATSQHWTSAGNITQSNIGKVIIYYREKRDPRMIGLFILSLML